MPARERCPEPLLEILCHPARRIHHPADAAQPPPVLRPPGLRAPARVLGMIHDQRRRQILRMPCLRAMGVSGCCGRRWERVNSDNVLLDISPLACVPLSEGARPQRDALAPTSVPRARRTASRYQKPTRLFPRSSHVVPVRWVGVSVREGTR